MRIASVEYFRVKPRWLFVKITDQAGNHGWGEATLEGHTLSVEGTLDEVKNLLVDNFDADRIEHIWQTLYRQGFYRGGPVFMSAQSGIDIALWDLKARKLGVPIYELLGGRVRDKVKVYAWIGGDEPDDVLSAARQRKAQGFKAVKMNATAGIDWLDSPSTLDGAVERLKAVKSVGLDAGLDFHGRVHKPMAKQLAAALEPLRPLFIEEPLLSEHSEGIKQLSDLTSIPIALGERLHTRWDVKRFLEDASIDVLQIDISHCGGLSEAKRIAAMAEAYDVALAPHCPLGPIALAACLQLAYCTANHTIQEMSLGIHYNTEAGDIDLDSYIVNKDAFTVKDGYVGLLHKPGLGIDVDEVAVRRVSSETTPWQSGTFFGPDAAIQEW